MINILVSFKITNNQLFTAKMTKLVLFFVLLFSIVFHGQSRKNQFQLNSKGEKHDLHVSFQAPFEITDKAALLIQFPQLIELVEEFQLDFEKTIHFSEDKWLEMEKNAILNKGEATSVIGLKNIFKIIVVNPTNEKLLNIAAAFEKLEKVNYASLISLTPIKPPFDIAPVTPNFQPNQTYIGPNPGLNMQYAWDLGIKGNGIRVRDVEYGFNKNHEDLNEVNAFVAEGMTISSAATTEYTEHGTPVFGIIMAAAGSYGITGLAHEVTEMVLFPEWQQSGYNRIFAVNQSIQNSTLGDVILFEMQEDGPVSGYTDYVPAEYNNVIWDLTKAATDAGIVIVAAAGNGNQDLDGNLYLSYLNRGNSGAILVGAGTPDINHNRFYQSGWWGSTYGTRVDVQGWAQNVFACGYGDFVMVGDDFNQGYTNFSGTSSATPLVAACAIVMQSYYKTLTGNYLSGPALRSILKETGIAQGTGVAGNIGPLPNMEAAIQRIYDEYVLGLTSQNKTEFSVFPNPVQDQLRFLLSENFSTTASLEIINSLGQKVFQNPMPSTLQLDISFLSNGIYFVKVTDGNQSTTKKIIKTAR